MSTVVLASRNAGKLREMQALLAPLGWQLKLVSDFTSDAAEETAPTFVENALLKARHAARVSGLPAIADDSGIEVDALRGEPGVRSARYAGFEAARFASEARWAAERPAMEDGRAGVSDAELGRAMDGWSQADQDQANNTKLLQALKDVPEAERGARFVCVMVYLRHAEDPVPVIAQGVWRGRIRHAPSGNNGFGYDPLFEVPTHGCASAELPPEVKNRISHRAQAASALLARLRTAEQPS